MFIPKIRRESHLVPAEQNYVGRSNLPFINEKSSRAVIYRSKLCNNFLDRTKKNRRKYTEQRNYHMSLLRKEGMLQEGISA